jgi:type IV secretion system protein VirB2
MNFWSRRDCLLPSLIICILIFAASDPALASSATFQPLNTALSSVLDLMTGTFATTAATVAVAAVGYLALTSRIPWGWAFSVVIGVALIFGAAQVVTSLTGGMGGR